MIGQVQKPTDEIIAMLEGSGPMSPKLRSLAEATRPKAPFYELRLSLFRKKERGPHE